MSQNQGNNPLTEEEIRDYINEIYGLRLERDAFVKPNKDVILDIYMKLLDEFWPKWRRDPGAFRDCEENPPVKALVVKYLRIVIKIYNESHNIDLTDLLTPTRHRTRMTMNYLILHRLRVQDILSKWREDKEELLSQQKELSQKRQALAQCKNQIEKLALEISASPPVEELKLKIISLERELEERKKRCDDICERAKEIKSKSLAKQELVKVEEAQAKQRKQEIKELKDTLEVLNNGLHITDKVADTERMIGEEESQLKITRDNIVKLKERERELQRLHSVQRLFDQKAGDLFDCVRNRITDIDRISESRKTAIERSKNSILKHQRETESLRERLATLEYEIQEKELSSKKENEKFKISIEAKKSDMRDREKAFVKKEAQMLREIEEVRKTQLELKTKFHEELGHHKSLIDKADRKVKLLEECYQKSQEQTERKQAVIAERRDKINALVGGVEPEVIEMPANRTYIKDSGANGKKEIAEINN